MKHFFRMSKSPLKIDRFGRSCTASLASGARSLLVPLFLVSKVDFQSLKFERFSKRQLRSKKFVIFAPHMTNGRNIPVISEMNCSPKRAGPRSENLRTFDRVERESAPMCAAICAFARTQSIRWVCFFALRSKNSSPEANN